MTRGTLADFGSHLQFDADQTAAAQALHDAYRREFVQLSAQANADVDTAFTKAPDVILRERVRITERFIEQSQELERRLLDDLRALCTPGQEARFAEVERMQRRAIGGRVTWAAGAGVDLVRVFEALGIGQGPATGEILGRWAAEVERIDRERDKVFREAIPQNLGGGGPDRAAHIRRYTADLYALSARRRDVMRKAVRELEAVLGAEDFARVSARVQEESFPRVYGGSPVLQLGARLDGGANLTEQQRTAVRELIAEYQREAAPVNARWAAALDAKQAATFSDPEGMPGNPDDPSDPFYSTRRARRSLDERYRERLLALLTQAQRELVPDSASPADYPEHLPDRGISEEAWEDFKRGG